MAFGSRAKTKVALEKTFPTNGKKDFKICLRILLKAYFTVEGSRERYSERLQENRSSRVLGLLGKSLAHTGAKLVLGTTGDVFQVSWKKTSTSASRG